MSRVKISVVICTRNRSDMIEMAIKSVTACKYDNFDVHIVDQSTDNLTEMVVNQYKKNDSRIIYHHLDRPGLSRSYNIGKNLTDGEYIACTDDDVIVPENWLAKIADRFDSDPKIGIIYGQVLIPEALNAAVKQGVVVPSLGWNTLELLSKSKNNYKTYGMGANSAVRRSAWTETGGFDEVMGVGAPLRGSQDFDFAYRIYHAGYTICLDPENTVDHYGTRLPSQWPDTLLNYGMGDGAYYGKHARLGAGWAIKYAATSLLKYGALSVLKALKIKESNNLIYLKNLFIGLKASMSYKIDGKTLMYIPKGSDSNVVNSANSVTRLSLVELEREK